MAPIALPSSHNLSIGCGGPSSSQIIKSRGGFVWRDLLVVWLGTLQCTFTDARGGDKLEAATAYLARKLVLNQTYDFLASCAVVVSSLLPPFAKTIKKRTGYVIVEQALVAFVSPCWFFCGEVFRLLDIYTGCRVSRMGMG
ncbi:hypothetical protein U9M48_022996 [Paspalum notatum var. saurae]|uniref:Uncharacterized protein n=1 Tax=Paspalum notatum var. saurae TaxID=547442 RepID=A0AAQ3WU77_PASNO